MAASVVGAAKITSTGKVVPLGPRSSPNDVVSVDDVRDPNKLARILGDVFEAVSMLLARWYPRRLDFEDVAVGASGAGLTLQHNFGGRVRYWVVDWSPSGTAAAPILVRGVETTKDTLVLYSYYAGVATIRLEESG